jgi:quinol monooxygenase YgiN
MFAWRTTWIVKPGRLEEAVAVTTKNVNETTLSKACAAVRVYSSHYGPTDTLVFEEVWSSIEAHDQWWDAYIQSAQGKAAFAAAYQVVERSTSTELWDVAEWRP